MFVSNRPIPSRRFRVAPIDISQRGVSLSNIRIWYIICFTSFKAIRVDIEPCVESIHGHLIVSRLEVNAAQTQTDWRSRCGCGLAYATSRNRAAEMRWQRTRRWRDISEIPSTERSDLFLSCGKPDEFALRRPIIVGTDQGLGRLPVGHYSRFEGITDKDRREIAHHLIESSDRLRSRRQDIRAAENRRRQNRSQPDRLDRDLDERSARRVARPIPRQDRVAVTWRQ